MRTDNFELKVIPIKNILVHEDFDKTRSVKLIKRFKKGGILTNPIIVAPLGKKKFLQLDGMNRLNCFKMMGIESILCQVVDYNNQEEVKLSSWIHLFKGKRKNFFDYIKKNKTLSIKKINTNEIGPRYIKERDFGRLITVVDKKSGSFLILTKGDFIEKIKRIGYVVSYYKDNISRAVLPFALTNRNIRLFFHEYPYLNFYDNPKANIMLVFPSLTPQQVIEVAQAGMVVPAGITRHLIGNRCLNVNIPLKIFDNSKSINQQNEMVNKILLKKSPRLYQETTINFE